MVAEHGLHGVWVVHGALRRWMKAAPVTVAIVAVATGLYLAVKVYEWRHPRDAGESLRVCGAVTRLAIFTAQEPGGEKTQVPQLYGPFDLWDGQWWRIPVSGFHHGGLLHLVMNGLAILFLGRLLESRLKKHTYLAFFLAANVVALLPEFLLEHDVVGLSAGAYAIFGALLVLRRFDWRIAEVFTDQVVQFGIVWLFGCVLLTALNYVNVANVAHFTGFA
jgi:membrane associated rhomboid family serine protease